MNKPIITENYEICLELPGYTDFGWYSCRTSSDNHNDGTIELMNKEVVQICRKQNLMPYEVSEAIKKAGYKFSPNVEYALQESPEMVELRKKANNDIKEHLSKGRTLHIISSEEDIEINNIKQLLITTGDEEGERLYIKKDDVWEFVDHTKVAFVFYDRIEEETIS